MFRPFDVGFLNRFSAPLFCEAARLLLGEVEFCGLLRVVMFWLNEDGGAGGAFEKVGEWLGRGFLETGSDLQKHSDLVLTIDSKMTIECKIVPLLMPK